MFNLNEISKIDPEVAKAIELEVNRQRNKIELIASENFVSKAVIEAMGTPLTNKYAEGYPGKRYYGGCEFVDIIKILRLNGQRKYSELSMRMCSRIQGLRQIWLCFLQC